MKHTYNFAQLDPRNNEAAQTTNEAIFAQGDVFGIEVTVPALAARCIGNIDPQHTQGDNNVAAIEECLRVELPREGMTLATVRADLDSVGSMGILTMRAQGITISETVKTRVNLIAESDKGAAAAWAPQELPTMENLWQNDQALETAVLAAAVSDFRVNLETRVTRMINWLRDGTMPSEYLEKVQAERLDMTKALEDGRIQAGLVDGIAIVTSNHRAATSVGYAMAPVVVAANPEFRFAGGEPHLKYTVCQYAPGYADIKAALAELNQMEPGWGGSPTIGGSPQGVSSRLTMDEVVSVVRKYLVK